MKTIPVASIVSSLLLAAHVLAAQTILVEAEGFADRGGWTVDQQAMDVMGSPYLLAHGLGAPVSDAVMKIKVAGGGEYRVWVRTRDWVAPWKAPGAPGRFQLLVNGKPHPYMLRWTRQDVADAIGDYFPIYLSYDICIFWHILLDIVE